MSPATLRRILISAPVLVTGCAVLTNDPGWQVERHDTPLPAVFVASSLERIQQACPKTPNAYGCAVRDYRVGLCWIYIPADAPVWLRAHELLHCAGYNHTQS